MVKEEIAAVLNESDYRWQHGIGSGGYDVINGNGYFLMLADALIKAGVFDVQA